MNSSRSKQQSEPDIANIISNPFAKGGSDSSSRPGSGQMDPVQQQKLMRMKQAAQRQSASHISMVTSSGMRQRFGSSSSNSGGTMVQSFRNDSQQSNFNDHSGIRDETVRRNSDFEEYTLRDDDSPQQKKGRPRFSVPDTQPPKELARAPSEPSVMSHEIVPSSLANQQSGTSAGLQSSNETTESDLEQQLKNRGMSAVYEPGVPKLVNQQQSQQSEQLDPRSRMSHNTLPELDLTDKKYFLSHPVPKEYGMIKCYIQRERGKLKLFPKYHLYFENGNKFLLSARKRKKNRSSNYLLSLERGDLSRGSPNFFGKVRSNFMGTEFMIFNDGSGPNKSKDPRNVRHEIGAILYETNILGTKGPRRLNIITPAVGPDGEFMTHPQIKGNPSLVQSYKEGKRNNIHVFTNKRPSWNEKLKAYVLNFNGRVTKASVKNFQLVEEGDNETVMLQFGKVSDNRFSLDFRYPLSGTQAFAIAMSAFDFKLLCE